MADHINDTFETSSGSKVLVIVPSSQGGSDRIIYVKGNNSGYKLGKHNDEVYKISSGDQAYKSIKDFIKNKYGGYFLSRAFASRLFFFVKKYFYI